MAEAKRGTPELPLPSDRLILMDLDKTLLNVDYVLTDEEVLTEIDRVQTLGWSLGLNSDTPLEPLRAWAQRLGINGPIVAEKGSVISVPGMDEIVIGDETNLFPRFKEALVRELIVTQIPFFHGDATQFVRNNPRLAELVDQRLVVINGYRRCSLSFYVRRVNEQGFLERDSQFFEEVVELMRRLTFDCELELTEDYNPEYGIYILSSSQINKRVGTLKLLELLSMSRIGMIGDSEVDIVGSDIAVQYAVGNASQRYKDAADHVAGGQYASGVAEILAQIKF